MKAVHVITLVFLATFFPAANASAVTVNASQSAEGIFDFSPILPPYTAIVFLINGMDVNVAGDFVVSIYTNTDAFVGSNTITVLTLATSGVSSSVDATSDTDPKGKIIISALGSTDFDFTSLSVEVCTGPEVCSPAVDITNSLTTSPLPAALPLFATGLGVIGLFGSRRQKKARTVAA